MPKLEKVGGKVQLEVERFDGGRNTKAAHSEISVYETPDDLNVTYDDQGAVSTREGSLLFNTTSIGSWIINGGASYNNSMVIWANGGMYYASGTTFDSVPSAMGVFASNTKIAYAVYQGVLFCSDGSVNYRYEAPTSFYQHGIAVPSNCNGSAPVGAGGVASGTYYFRVAYENTHVVEGEAGAYLTLAHPNSVCTHRLYSIPVGAASLGVAKRQIYRASATGGPWRWIAEVADNVTTTYDDVTSSTTWNTGRLAIEDGTAPTPYKTVKAHKERLFFPDNTDKSLIRWTNFSNPYISEAENYYPLLEGGGGVIQAIGVQDDVVSCFLDNAIWLGVLNQPEDDQTWGWVKSPANLGIVGADALWEGPGFIFFLARSAAGSANGNIYGYCLLQGADVQDATMGPLRTKSISEKIEPDVLAMPAAYWTNSALIGFDNKVHAAVTLPDSVVNEHIYWFDISRLVTAGEGQPGSWALWNGIPVRCWWVHNGKLYGGSSYADGFVRQLYSGTYDDSGAAIDSYFWTKNLGGEGQIESWIKDFRWLNVWYKQIGSGQWMIYSKAEKIYNISDGTSTGGDENLVVTVYNSDLAALYGTGIWGTDTFYSDPDVVEGQWPLTENGRRLAIKFTNGNVAGRAFKVNAIKMLMNMRRQK